MQLFLRILFFPVMTECSSSKQYLTWSKSKCHEVRVFDLKLNKRGRNYLLSDKFSDVDAVEIDGSESAVHVGGAAVIYSLSRHVAHFLFLICVLDFLKY